MTLIGLVTKPSAFSVHSTRGAEDSWSAEGLVTRSVNVKERSNWLASNPTLVRRQTEIETLQGCTDLELDDESLIASFSDAPEADQADIEAARLPNVEADERSAIEPFSQRPPRGRRYVYIWHCVSCPTSGRALMKKINEPNTPGQCACGKAGIGIMVECCPDCGASRCPYCRTEKVRIQ